VFWGHDDRGGPVFDSSGSIPTSGSAFDEFGRFRSNLAKQELEKLRDQKDSNIADRWKEFDREQRKPKNESPKAKRRRIAKENADEAAIAERLTENVIKAHMGVGAMNDAIMNSTIFNRIMDERDKAEAERRLIEMGTNPFKKGQEVITMSAYLNEGFQTQRYRTKMNPPPPPKHGLKFFHSLKTARERNKVLNRAELDLSRYPTLREAKEIAQQKARQKADTKDEKKEGGEKEVVKTAFDALVEEKDDVQKENKAAASNDLFGQVFGGEESDDSED